MNKTESSIDRWLRTGFILFLIFLLMVIIFTGTGKGSDVSNWIIAGANIVMAAAAVKAWRAAQKFLGEFFAQEGYRLAIELINENVIHLGIDNEFTLRAHNAFSVCSELDGKKHSDADFARLIHVVNQLQALQNRHTTLLTNIRSLSFRMETYGIFAAEAKKDSLTQMVLALDDMNQLGAKLVDYLQADAGRYSQTIKSRTNFFMPFSSQKLTEEKELLAKINTNWNLMVSSRHSLLSGGKHARTLFVVRES